MSVRLLTRKQVAEILGISVSTVYKKMKLAENPLPKPIRLGKQARRWKESAVLGWIESLPEADPAEWESPKVREMRKKADVEGSPAPTAPAT